MNLSGIVNGLVSGSGFSDLLFQATVSGLSLPELNELELRMLISLVSVRLYKVH